MPYRFSFIRDLGQPSIDITTDLYNAILKPTVKSTEDIITLHFTPLAIFKVRAVTRCSASIAGHAQPILAAQFSPTHSSRMTTGSGDNNARIWDCETGTPFATLKGHTSWVLAVAYSPDGDTIATGSMDNTIRLWDGRSGAPLNNNAPLRGHSKWITSLSWEPFHLAEDGCPRLASSSKDGSARVWDVTRGTADLCLTRHNGSVSCVKWSGDGVIYTASHDKTIMAWDSKSGTQLKTLTAHAHWVNHLALSTDHVLRTAYRTPGPKSAAGDEPILLAARRARAKERHQAIHGKRMVSASDDNTLFLWDPDALSKPIARLVGHQKQVNHVTFSPDGSLLASSGFDNAIKLWRARDGQFLRTLRGHVGPVYMVSWSADSRLLVSASKDTTCKVWDATSGKMVEDLVGHKDEVFAVDWSADGSRACSGGRDKHVRVWAN